MEGSDEELLGGDSEYMPLEGDDFDEEGMDDFDYPDEDIDFTPSEPKPMGGIYALFNSVLTKKDSTKVSNLNKIELGDLGISVRGCQKIALLGTTFHHPIFAKFFKDQAKIITDSAMSKEGWFTELFVTSKKYASRSSSSDTTALPQFNDGKWKMFSGKNKKHG